MKGPAKAIISKLLRRINVGQLVVHEGGSSLIFGPGGEPSAILEVHSRKFWTRLLRGGRGLGEAYRDGLWDSPDLAGVFRLAARNAAKLDAARRRLAFVRLPLLHLRAGFIRNTPQRSRKDIAAHYDLGNDLFALMLDPTMMYSCAVFERDDTTLDEAALHKLEMVCAKLDLSPRDRVVEIGTGWGGFAVYAATTRGCHVTTTTISREQYDFAVQLVHDRGIGHLVDVRFDDYRDLHGTFDKLVSLEMIEAVGHKDFGTYFECCSTLLEPDGAMLLQAIIIGDDSFEIEKLSRSFIRTYIFPNGCMPSLRVITGNLSRRTDMRLVALEDLTPNYATTLRHWRANFERAAPELGRLGYDGSFQRLWRMYLAYVEAGFAEQRIGLVQMVVVKPQHRKRRLETLV